MRATVEYHGIDADYPPIKVVIADGSDNEDVIIKVSDEGGGIPRSNMKRIWSYVSICYICIVIVRRGYSDSLVSAISHPFLFCTKNFKVIHNCRPRNPRGYGNLQRECRL